MTLKTTPFDAAEYFDTVESQIELLSDALAEGHAGYIANAIGVVAKARGMSKLANETGLNRQTLYGSLKKDGNPTLETVLKVLKALGMELEVKQAPARELESA